MKLERTTKDGKFKYKQHAGKGINFVKVDNKDILQDIMYLCSVMIPAVSMDFCQMIGKDKDYRYMATSDLLNELNREGFKADTDLEVKLSNIVLQQLEDASGDVSGLAVKWFALVPNAM